MPLVRIGVRKGLGRDLAALGDAVHRAMVASIAVPAQDRFQILTERDDMGLIYDPAYLDIPRSDGIVIIQITLNAGRAVALKKALYAAIAENLAALGVRREDVFVSLVEVPRENWSFGNGIAQYAD